MVTIIAEASKNFITRPDITVKEALENAKKLALVAKECGADIFKTQCHVFEDEARKRPHKRHEWIRLNEYLTPYKEFWKPLKEYCDLISIEMLVTPMSRLAAQKVEPLVKRFKVASPDIQDFYLLEYLKSTGKEIILSSGMTDKKIQQKSCDFLQDNYHILHCVSEYPCPVEHLNLWELTFYDGLSDHSLSLITGALAVMKGSKFVEKHFKIDENCKDANVSLNPEQLKTYIDNIREAEKTLIINSRPTSEEIRVLSEHWK